MVTAEEKLRYTGEAVQPAAVESCACACEDRPAGRVVALPGTLTEGGRMAESGLNPSELVLHTHTTH